MWGNRTRMLEVTPLLWKWQVVQALKYECELLNQALILPLEIYLTWMT